MRPLLLSVSYAVALASAPGCGSSATGTDDTGIVPDGGTSSTPDAGSPVACGSPTVFGGEATYYTFADGTGNCGFPATPSDRMVAAINAPQYDHSNACGMCAHITGPSGEVTVRIVDQCPECPSGNLDLSPQAFDRIALRALGRVPIQWYEVPCEVTGPIVYHFKDGSNPWWTAIQIRNHRHRVAKLEAMSAAGWESIARLDYNYFVAASGLGPGPYRLRTTDIHGEVIADSDVPSLDAADVPSASQFPACH